MQDLKSILSKVTVIILDRMQIAFEPGRELTSWDINRGWCGEWALEAKALVGDGEAIWLNEIKDSRLMGKPKSHCVFVFDGMYYDSQHMDGVDDVMKLDFVNKVTFEEWKAINAQRESVTKWHKKT